MVTPATTVRNENPNKRARSAGATSLPPTDTGENLPPRRSAERWLENALTSLPPELKTILGEPFRQCLRKFCQLNERKQAHEKITANDAPLPRSIRFKFQLTASNRVSEDLEFQEMQSKASAIISDSQKQLADLIKKTSEMELTAAKNECAVDVLNTVLRLGKACMIYKHIKHISDNAESNLFHCCIYNTDFATLMPRNYLLGNQGLISEQIRKWVDVEPTEPRTTELLTSETAVLAMVREYMVKFIAKPREIYEEQTQRQATLQTLQATFHEHDTEKATAAAMEILDSDSTATPETIRRIASEEAKKATDRCIKQLKGGRGAHSGAPSKKKNKQAPKRQQQQQTQGPTVAPKKKNEQAPKRQQQRQTQGPAVASNNASKHGNSVNKSNKNNRKTKPGDEQKSNKKQVSFARSTKKS